MDTKPINFKIEAELDNGLGRAGVINTPHGPIKTPAFVTVGTKATVKALSPDQVKTLGAQVVLANTYHLLLQPGDEVVATAGGLHQFMNWSGPIMTDSGGFQVFSLGAAYGQGGISKFASSQNITEEKLTVVSKPAQIDDEGVTFKSHIDGREHRLTPEISMAIQHNLGADIIFAFDECTTPTADYDYQKKAMDRTHTWAERSLRAHQASGQNKKQGLFGIVQGGRFQDLRQESARIIAGMDFAGFGIGGSFVKEDLDTALTWVNSILPPDKSRHLLGIGRPEDLILGVSNGADTFDCVAPTRMARNGTLDTKEGRINILNSKYKKDFQPLEADCDCYTCQNFTRAYLAHLFRAGEMLGPVLASVHNLFFINQLVDNLRQAIIDNNYKEFTTGFLGRYGG
ncbi:MAG: tRNA guanosine(34) transglycosylase Tgt [Patescibacteria group bacterium]